MAPLPPLLERFRALGPDRATTLRIPWPSEWIVGWVIAALVATPFASFGLYLGVESLGLPPVGQEDYVTLFLVGLATSVALPASALGGPLLVRTRATAVELGPDGVSVAYDGGFHQGFHVPWAAVSDVVPSRRGVALETTAGVRVIQLGRGRTALGEALAAALVAHRVDNQ